jgi:putative glutamine amidotransferase
LISDITDFTLHRGPTHEALFIDERIRIDPTSRVAGLLGRDQLVVRTGHHQAIRKLGAGLRAVGWAADGLTEAVEHQRGWVVGVQWHPEESQASADDRRCLFDGLVRAAADRRSRYHRP